MKDIDSRIEEIDRQIISKLSESQKWYRDLTELEKIPLRVLQAEKTALLEIKEKADLRNYLKECVENEWYCGAEGIKRALEFINQ